MESIGTQQVSADLDRFDPAKYAWAPADHPSAKHVARIEERGIRDDACEQMLDLRRRDVFERVCGEHLADATNAVLRRACPTNRNTSATHEATSCHREGRASGTREGRGSIPWRPRALRRFRNTARAVANALGFFRVIRERAEAEVRQRMDRIERAIVTVPIRIGAKRVKEQIKASGPRALDHIEVAALVQREAHERDRLMEYVHLAATDPRFTDFEDWARFVDEQKIGKRRQPEQINYHQAKDIMRTALEPLAALHAANAWGREARVSLGNDIAKQNDPSRANLPSFDLTVHGADGKARSNVEVTTVQINVRKPSDLTNAIRHGIKKSQALPSSSDSGRREVSVAVPWFKGRVGIDGARRVGKDGAYVDARGDKHEADPLYIDADGNYIEIGKRYIDYNGKGDYSIYRRTGTNPHEDAGDEYLYKRNIVTDDFPHYLHRHPNASKWLDRVNIFTDDGSALYELIRSGSSWRVRTTENVDAALQERRAERHRRRGWIAEPLEFSRSARHQQPDTTDASPRHASPVHEAPDIPKKPLAATQ